MSRIPLTLTNFTCGEVSPRLAGRVDMAKYYNGCMTLTNFLVHPHGGVTRRSGMRYVADCASHGSRSLLVPFEDAAGQPWVLEFAEGGPGAGVIRFFAQGGQVLDGSGNPLELASPYLAGHLDGLRAVQERQALILTHQALAPRQLTRSAEGAWSLTELSFTSRPEAWGQGNWPGLAAFHEDRLVFAATPKEPYTLWFSRTGEHQDFRLATREVPLSGWSDLEIEDKGGSGAAEGRAGDTFAMLNGDSFKKNKALAGEKPDGTPCYYRYLGAREFRAGSGGLTVTFRDAPSAATDIESIRTSAGALNAAAWEEFSVGDRIDADPASPDGSDPLDDDGLEITLSAQQGGRIAFLSSRGRLWVGATSGEWTISGSSLNTPVTPGGVKANREGTSGAALAQSCPAGAATLFIQRSGRKVREMAYRMDSDAYVSRDLTLLAGHMAGPGFTQLAFVQEPDPVLYCVRADGVLAALTYLPDQDVCAFSRIATDGAVESVCAVSNDEAGRDELWLTVRRQLPDPAHPGGAALTRRFVERLEPGFAEDAPDSTGAFFVDSGMTYSGPPASVLTGLAHLAGREVHVLADGAVLPPRVVGPDGTLALDREASVVHAGLPYHSVLRPMRLEFSGARGSAQTRTKRICEVSLRLFLTLGGKVGPDENRLEPLLFRTSADLMGRAPALFSGDKTVRFPHGWDQDGLMVVVQDQPLPMTILLLAPVLAMNE